jgi:ribosome-associated protein
MDKRPPALKIQPGEIHFDFVRSSGPGGQNVNKVATAVQLRFDARSSNSLTPEVKTRLMRLAGNRLTRNGEIIIEASRFRSQQMNRDDALERLARLIEQASVRPKPRHKTKPTRSAKLRRLETKRRRSETKQFRTSKLED